MLGLGSVTAKDVYATLDWLGSEQSFIEAALARRHLSNGALLLYDVTSTYLEERCCELARHGYNPPEVAKGVADQINSAMAPGASVSTITEGSLRRMARRRIRRTRCEDRGERGWRKPAHKLPPPNAPSWRACSRSSQPAARASEPSNAAHLICCSNGSPDRQPCYPARSIS